MTWVAACHTGRAGQADLLQCVEEESQAFCLPLGSDVESTPRAELLAGICLAVTDMDSPIDSTTGLEEGHGAGSEAELVAEDEDEASPASPNSGRRCRRRRQRRGRKSAVASISSSITVSTASPSTASGGPDSHSQSEDDAAMQGSVHLGRRGPGVVTWGDLGLNLGTASTISPIIGAASLAPTSPAALPWREGITLPPSIAAPSTPAASSTSAWVPYWQAAVSSPHGAWGMPPGAASTPTAAAMSAGVTSYSCSPVGSGAPLVGADAAVRSWLHERGLPECGEDLAQRLRAMAPEAYED